MGRRRRPSQGAAIIDIVKFGIIALVLIVLALFGVQGLKLIPVILTWIALIAVGALVLAVVVMLAVKYWRRNHSGDLLPAHQNVGAKAPPGESPGRTAAPVTERHTLLAPRDIYDQLLKIDWFQFEKLNAALLAAAGYGVERKGGAHPDGGVDILATAKSDGRQRLVQCKHWVTWKVNEKTVREMLGAMTHFKVQTGEIRATGGWTEPAAKLASQHGIALIDGRQIAAEAHLRLPQDRLTALLDASTKHCPKCESPMVLRTGNFDPFWGCSRFPRCRGSMKERPSGASA